MNKNTVIILDPGHSKVTPGKCSPDGRLKEYAYVRDVLQRVKSKLEALGYKVVNNVPEVDIEISLKERCRRANKVYAESGKNAILISIHVNAAGADGKWHNASGWSVFVAPNASSNSKKLAQSLYKYAEEAKILGNRFVPKDKYWVQNLAMCRDTNCPAVLTENLFQDNKSDVDFLLSEEGLETIANVHVNGIING